MKKGQVYMIENNNGTKKREWVKNAIIIFLVIMLILTFFSNTIMNWSLPEVSAQYVMGGTLSEQIRGTATVESAESYNIIIDEERTVQSIKVNEGDKVEKDQVLFLLDPSENSKLEAAEEELATAQREYDKLLLKTGKSYTLEELEIKNMEEDIAEAKNDLNKIGEYQELYKEAKAETQKKADKVDELKSRIEEYDSTLSVLSSDDYTSLDEKYYKKIKSLVDSVTYAEKRKKEDEKKLEELSGGGSSVSNSEIISAKAAVDKKANEYNDLYAKYLDDIMNGRNVAETGSEKAMKDASVELDELRQQYKDLIEQQNKGAVNEWQIASTKQSLENMEKNYDSAKTKLTDTIVSLMKEVNDAKKTDSQKLKDAERELKDAEEKEAEAKEKASVSVEQAEENIKNKERELEVKRITLDQTKTNDLAEAGISSIDIEEKKAAIDKIKKRLEKLSENDNGNEIRAQTAGVIGKINVVAGEKTAPGAAIATIEMTEKGYTASITVTNEQAKKVKMGEEADVQYFWYGDASAVLTAIKADTANPTQNKQLIFSVTGDVTPGQSLQLVMGSKGQQYEMIVPNSSIREDNNGKFVLTVVAKSSPLGNRYIAKRVDITVIASDDTKSAVSGELMQSDFVIATSTKPINAGEQVRLVDSQ